MFGTDMKSVDQQTSRPIAATASAAGAGAAAAVSDRRDQKSVTALISDKTKLTKSLTVLKNARKKLNELSVSDDEAVLAVSLMDAELNDAKKSAINFEQKENDGSFEVYYSHLETIENLGQHAGALAARLAEFESIRKALSKEIQDITATNNQSMQKLVNSLQQILSKFEDKYIPKLTQVLAQYQDAICNHMSRYLNKLQQAPNKISEFEQFLLTGRNELLVWLESWQEAAKAGKALSDRTLVEVANQKLKDHEAALEQEPLSRFCLRN